MSDFPNCPKCDSEFTYKDGHIFICPECFHEWSDVEKEEVEDVVEDTSVKDAYGNSLNDGDDVSIIKDLKVKKSLEYPNIRAEALVVFFKCDILS
jgi:protein PhnA